MNAATPEAFLQSLPDERRTPISAARQAVLAGLPAGYQEVVRSTMLCYEVPLDHYPDTYNRQPLQLAAIASQKNHCALYMTGPYMDAELRELLERRYRDAGRRLDMGKSCLRFRKAEDLLPDAIADVIARTPPDQFIALYEASRLKV
jgi:hypothetical protein